MVDGEPFPSHDARRRVRRILESGFVNYDEPHFLREAAKDRIDILDVANVLRCGIVQEGEWENGGWRYQVRTQKFCVVVAFEAEDELVLVTAWRYRS